MQRVKCCISNETSEINLLPGQIGLNLCTNGMQCLIAEDVPLPSLFLLLSFHVLYLGCHLVHSQMSDTEFH